MKNFNDSQRIFNVTTFSLMPIPSKTYIQKSDRPPKKYPIPIHAGSSKDAIPEATPTQVYGQIEAVKTAFEGAIDNLVYRLYNLTYDEVKVIEPGFAI